MRQGAGRDLPRVQIPLVANGHPLQVDPGIGFLGAFEGFGFVSGWPFPDEPLLGSWPVLGSRARDRFDITADKCDDFPGGHIEVGVPGSVKVNRKHPVDALRSSGRRLGFRVEVIAVRSKGAPEFEYILFRFRRHEYLWKIGWRIGKPVGDGKQIEGIFSVLCIRQVVRK